MRSVGRREHIELDVVISFSGYSWSVLSTLGSRPCWSLQKGSGWFFKALGVLQAVLNPSIAEATFFQSTRMQRFLKAIQTLSHWYSLNSSRWVLSDEYPFARVSVIFLGFCIHFHQQHKGLPFHAWSFCHSLSQQDVWVTFGHPNPQNSTLNTCHSFCF